MAQEEVVIRFPFDGNAETLKAEFWTLKTMLTYRDFYPWKKYVFFQYGSEVALSNPKPYLVDNEDGSTDLIVEFVPKTVREFRGRYWQYIPFLFIVLPLRWFSRLVIGLWSDIFEVTYR
jgi:hypothetical protein